MSKNNTIFLIGALLFIMPVLGFPSSWKNSFDVVFGLILVGLSFSVVLKRRASLRKNRRNRKTSATPVFVDAMSDSPRSSAPDTMSREETEQSSSAGQSQTP